MKLQHKCVTKYLITVRASSDKKQMLLERGYDFVGKY